MGSPADNLRILEALLLEVGVTHIFSDWPYTVNAFAQCVMPSGAFHGIQRPFYVLGFLMLFSF